ncbi:MAG: hypothetical protein ACRD4Q_07210 [Candidatus Acidiferrales bacterium]
MSGSNRVGYLSSGMGGMGGNDAGGGIYNTMAAMRASLIPALWHSMKVTLRVLWRVTRQVFHEATGALFGLFAAYGALLAWRQWRHGPILWLIGFAVAYSIMMAAFAVGSFRRARRVR